MRWVVVLAGWTVLVWAGRIRNVAADDDLGGLGLAWRAVVAVLFLALAVATLLLLWRERAGRPTPLVPLVRAFAGATVAFWVVRGAGILLDDHDLGFEVVHTVLAVASSALALLAARAVSTRRPPSARTDRLAAG